MASLVREGQTSRGCQEGGSGICENMDGPGGHFAKGNKPDVEGQILHDLTYIKKVE